MRAPTRERKISIRALVLVISIGFLVPKVASRSDRYSKIAPVDQHLMERNAEILLVLSWESCFLGCHPREIGSPGAGFALPIVAPGLPLISRDEVLEKYRMAQGT